MKHRFRPQRSVNLLAGIIRIAMISRNDVIASCTPWTFVSRSSLMSLIITFMFEPAKLQMNCASASGSKNLRRATPPSRLNLRVGFRSRDGRRRADQRQVAERLGEVADLPLALHVVLFRQQAEI